MEEKQLLEEMKKIVQYASGRGALLRGLGAAAIRSHSIIFVEKCATVRRDLTDLDFMTYSRYEKQAMEAFRECGYEQDRARAYIRAVSGRSILENRTSHLIVDLFFDKLSYNHTLILNGRLEKDPLTIPLADLLLEKTQIVQINEKDVKDTILLLREHSLGSDDDEKINLDRLCAVLSADWGFYYTVTTNLNRIEEYAKSLQGLNDIDRTDVTTKIQQLRKTLESAPKSLGWKMRAKVGPSRKWYADVEELAAGH